MMIVEVTPISTPLKALPVSIITFSGFQFDTDDGDKVLPDFLNSIAGIKRGETKTFPYVFPDTWKQEDLRGVRALFTVNFNLACYAYSCYFY